ncbi:phasin family protein [Halomonas sp. CS7]|uniref:Phasin family protein n=1 Tax=Halomonas pelophila TaxID=3151122 RepID=A0ABV1N5S6_9GAMM
MSAKKTRKDIDQTVEKTTDQSKQQFENAIVEPVRAHGSLTTDYYQELFSTQNDAVRAFADTSLALSRSWLDVKDSESFQKVVEEQQQTIQEMSERFKADTDKIRTLTQEYLKESQQLATESMQKGKQQIEDNIQQGQKQRQEDVHEDQDQVEESMKKGEKEVDVAQKKESASS